MSSGAIELMVEARPRDIGAFEVPRAAVGAPENDRFPKVPGDELERIPLPVRAHKLT